MAALAIVLSVPPFAIPLPLPGFTSEIHFFQLAIFLCAIIAGPWAGLVSGAVGALYMGIERIPFIIGGIALLGFMTGILSKKFRPVFACLVAWIVYAPYVVLTDYIWFTGFVGMPSSNAWALIAPIMVNLALQGVISAILADLIVNYVKRSKLID